MRILVATDPMWISGFARCELSTSPVKKYCDQWRNLLVVLKRPKPTVRSNLHMATSTRTTVPKGVGFRQVRILVDRLIRCASAPPGGTFSYSSGHHPPNVTLPGCKPDSPTHSCVPTPGTPFAHVSSPVLNANWFSHLCFCDFTQTSHFCHGPATSVIVVCCFGTCPRRSLACLPKPWRTHLSTTFSSTTVPTCINVRQLCVCLPTWQRSDPNSWIRFPSLFSNPCVVPVSRCSQWLFVFVCSRVTSSAVFSRALGPDINLFSLWLLSLGRDHDCFMFLFWSIFRDLVLHFLMSGRAKSRTTEDEHITTLVKEGRHRSRVWRWRDQGRRNQLSLAQRPSLKMSSSATRKVFVIGQGGSVHAWRPAMATRRVCVEWLEEQRASLFGSRRPAVRVATSRKQNEDLTKHHRSCRPLTSTIPAGNHR